MQMTMMPATVMHQMMNLTMGDSWIIIQLDDCWLAASPQNDGDEEDCSVLSEGSPGREETVESVQEHGDHDDVHGVPVGVPLDLYHPLPEIKIEPWERGGYTWICHDNELSPDPDTDTEVGQSHQQHDDIGDEEDVLEALQPLRGRLKVWISDWTVTHLCVSVLLCSLSTN